MKSHSTIAWFACLVLAGLGLSAQAAEWGTITGRIVYDGKVPDLKPLVVDKDQAVCGANKPDESLEVGPGGGLKNALVWVRTDNIAVAPEYEATAKEPVVLDNSKCRFEPHVLVMRTSQPLKIKNSDTAGHNTKLDAQNNAAFNDLIPAGQDVTKTLDKPETLPVRVGCNIHTWMGGYVLIRPNPYAAVTGDKGDFTIKDLPAGKELEFQLWQEKAGYLANAKNKDVKVDKKGRFKYTVKPGENDLGDFVVAASVFKK